jgi:hypothetical protein
LGRRREKAAKKNIVENENVVYNIVRQCWDKVLNLACEIATGMGAFLHYVR